MNVPPLPKLCIYLNGIQMIQFIFENFIRNLPVARIFFFFTWKGNFKCLFISLVYNSLFRWSLLVIYLFFYLIFIPFSGFF